MALPSFNLPGKNITPDKQMAMMRTYLNQLKDDTESELYDIKWDNLSKPLKEKIESLDREVTTATELADYIQANTVSAGWVYANFVATDELAAKVIQAGFVTTNYLESEFVYAGAIAASQITSGRISTTYLDASIITTDTFAAQEINANKITSGTVAANRISTAIMRTSNFTATTVAALFSSFDAAEFGYIKADYVRVMNEIQMEVNGAQRVFKPKKINGVYYIATDYTD